MRYAFVAKHRPLFSVRAMCRCLRIHPSGFYAWLKTPFSKRAIEDKRQTKLLDDAWKDSGKVYGYRKLHDDLCDQGESCCPNRVARLARLAGIKAQIGYKHRPGKYGGKPPVIVDNTLNRQFEVNVPDRVLQALLMAVWRRKPSNNVLVHSDQGSQFTSMDWASFLKAHNLEHSPLSDTAYRLPGSA